MWHSTQVLHRFKCWEREVDTKPHPQPRNYLQLTTDSEERPVLPQWSLTGFINHTPGVADQYKMNSVVLLCALVLLRFVLSFFCLVGLLFIHFLIFIFVFTWGLVCVSYFLFLFHGCFFVCFFERDRKRKRSSGWVSMEVGRIWQLLGERKM